MILRAKIKKMMLADGRIRVFLATCDSAFISLPKVSSIFTRSHKELIDGRALRAVTRTRGESARNPIDFPFRV